jgi:SAM-dependent MidA family methyltransferase
LYSPGLGYYSGGTAKLGAEGDFTTAPEMTPLFSQSLAHAACALFPQMSQIPQIPNKGLRILEFGAGSGRLAHDLLSELQQMQIPVEQYAILELSGSLRARQQAILHQFPEVCWLDQLPAMFSGLILANEVLDAMPVHLVLKRGGGWEEMRVGIGSVGFCWQAAACSDLLLESIATQIPNPEHLPEGYATEIHPVAAGFIHSLGRMMQGPSVALLIDYGFPAHEYYLDQRIRGTLHCHYRHHAHDDPFYLPGLQDITAHVDFTDIARQAQQAGLDVLSYSSQAAFLLDSGITTLLQRTDPGDADRYLPQSNALQRLLSPAEMGELFKVIILGRHFELPLCYAHNNRSHRL